AWLRPAAPRCGYRTPRAGLAITDLRRSQSAYVDVKIVALLAFGLLLHVRSYGGNQLERCVEIGSTCEHADDDDLSQSLHCLDGQSTRPVARSDRLEGLPATPARPCQQGRPEVASPLSGAMGRIRVQSSKAAKLRRPLSRKKMTLVLAQIVA